MLTVTELAAGYGAQTILRDVTFQLGRGDRVVVVGRNGVGKTTLLRAIAGHIAIQSGRCTLGGTELQQLKPHMRARLGLALVPQGRAIFPRLTVIQNLSVGPKALGLAGIADRLDTIFTQFPILAEHRHKPGGYLSGGQQQILAIARALITGPKVLLLDEPSEGVQPSIVNEIADFLVEANKNTDITILVVEQNLEFATRVATRALFIDKGVVAEEVATDVLATSAELQQRYMAL